jgi:hypothetical protein
MNIQIGDLVKAVEFIDPSRYLFGMIVGYADEERVPKPFKVIWLHDKAGWTNGNDFWYEHELELLYE